MTVDRVGVYKIGSILFTKFGPRALEVARNAGREIFLDLKFHDIPNTVKGAVRAAASWGVSLLTVHTTGGVDMMAAATEGASAGADAAGVERPRVIGVTVLTSLAAQGRDPRGSRLEQLDPSVPGPAAAWPQAPACR